MTKETDPDTLKRSYRELKEKGFTAAKIFVNGPVKSTNDGRDEFFSGRIHDEVEKVRICREAVGDDFDFVLEVHRGMTVPEAISFAREVESYRPMVLEDPITPDNIDAMAEVAQKTRIPIATGERFTNLKEFEMLMQRRAAQYIRPDVCAIGGITTTKKICAIAEANDVLVIPHNPLGPVSTAACLQICACIPNLGIQELPGFCLNGAEDAMVKTPLAYKDGCMNIPDAPGIGVELADNAAELYPANERGQQRRQACLRRQRERLVTFSSIFSIVKAAVPPVSGWDGGFPVAGIDSSLMDILYWKKHAAPAAESRHLWI